MTRIKVFIILLTFYFSGFSQTKNLIIDTDAAVDDFRAINLILSIPEFQVSLITASDGVLSPTQGSRKVSALLKSLNITNIPIAAGRKLAAKNPEWNTTASQMKWGNEDSIAPILLKADQAIITVLKSSQNQVTILALGPLTNIADVLKTFPEAKQKIKQIIWYNEKISPISGFNGERDKIATEFVLSTGVSLTLISNTEKAENMIDEDFLAQLAKISLPSAKMVESSINQLGTHNHALKFWDDLVPVFMLRPNMFTIRENPLKPGISECIGFPAPKVKSMMLEIYAQTYSHENNIIFDKFPAKPEMYQFDVQDDVNEIVKKYGIEEWKFCVLTNEIHGHLGVYSIVGAKMGLKAREILNAPLDRIEVTSFAGSFPPLSCLNDGLQISTGATLGLGLIHIASDSLKRPQATFKFNNKSVRLTLKKSYNDLVDQDIKDGILKYGNLTQGYWKLVRMQGMKYWKNWNRNEIFEIEFLN
jgi:inosine-uridine nucleoside N-ribohydrolase/formylmethanofuran dehydrogenase subunit E